MDAGLRTALAQRHLELGDRYEQLTANVAAQVTDWRWSRLLSRWQDPRPLAAEREGERLGRLTRARTQGRFRDQDQVGLDAAGRVVIVRNHDGAGGLSMEHFLVRHFDRIEAAAFEPRGPSSPPSMSRLLWVVLGAGERPLEAHIYWPNGRVASEHYEYDDAGRLLRIRGTTESDPDYRDAGNTSTELTPTYDERGALIAVDQHQECAGQHDRRRVWRLPIDRQQLTSLTKAAEDGLVSRIADLVASCRPSEPLAAIGLLYDFESVVPPMLGVLTESERDNFIHDHRDDVAPYLWNPAEWRWFDAPDLSLSNDPELLAVIEELVLEWHMTGDHQPGRKLLNRAARRLNEIDWPVPVVADFAVFASDLELVETPTNVRRALPAKRLRVLRRRGWLLEGN